MRLLLNSWKKTLICKSTKIVGILWNCFKNCEFRSKFSDQCKVQMTNAYTSLLCISTSERMLAHAFAWSKKISFLFVSLSYAWWKKYFFTHFWMILIVHAFAGRNTQQCTKPRIPKSKDPVTSLLNTVQWSAFLVKLRIFYTWWPESSLLESMVLSFSTDSLEPIPSSVEAAAVLDSKQKQTG